MRQLQLALGQILSPPFQHLLVSPEKVVQHIVHTFSCDVAHIVTILTSQTFAVIIHRTPTMCLYLMAQ